MSDNDEDEQKAEIRSQKRASLSQAMDYHKLSIQSSKCKVLKREMFTKMKQEKSKVTFIILLCSQTFINR